ncbi:MAG TPA: FKBP-type peptidyl-prolyl cis-trans isomerase [Acidobacteriota bacterium]
MMRLLVPLIVAALAVAGSACSSSSTGPAGTPETLEERASYAIGFSAGQSFTEQGAEIDVDRLVQGLRDALEGAEPALAAEQMQATMMEYQQAMAAAADVRAEELGRANIAAGEAFLAENAAREGVTVLPSGLQYEVVEQGDGPSPTATDEVTVHYEGRFLDGTPFDSSHDRGVPATFRLNAVIPGWTEGVQLMQVGSTYRFFIPGPLAYGLTPPPNSPIEPNATLIFDVELLAINGQS